jgi:hypothetical protein
MSWVKEYSWLYYDKDHEGAFCKICKQSGMSSSHVQRSGGVWVTKPFKNWKKAVEKMKAHASLAANRAAIDGTVVHQL